MMKSSSLESPGATQALIGKVGTAEPIDVVELDAREAWERVRRRLRAEIGEEVYSSWFPRLELDDIAGTTVRLSVPTRFLKTWIQQHYIDRLNALWGEEMAELRVELIVRTAVLRSPGAAPMPVRAMVRPATPQPAPQEIRAATTSSVDIGTGAGSPLDARLTFGTYRL